MRNWKRFSLIAVVASSLSYSQEHHTRAQERERDTERRRNEVSLGTQVWSYDRIYPLLDGLFQDVAATQLASLSLNPNASNGTNLDVLQQSFQLQVQANQLAGVQNAAAAQTVQANARYQSLLVQQEGSLLQALVSAQSQQGQAQSAFDTISASTTATSDQVAAAKLALTTATNSATAISNQLGSIKNAIAAPGPITAASGSLTSAPATPAALPSALLTSALSGTPSLPATKQMDNQIGLLWERLARLVGAMTKPDNIQTAELDLVKFDIGINPYQRKQQLLDVSYSLGCSSGTAPVVVDLFPRTAAVNLANIKYRDTSIGLSTLLSFFSVGVSAAYNREHLRATQMLGQSSYITGHGVGLNEFGWVFGITMGEDTIAPGERSTFALIAVPQDCKDPDVKFKSAEWSKFPNSAPVMANQSLSVDGTGRACNDCIKSIQFNRVPEPLRSRCSGDCER
jgi:hypothetical protein